MAPRQAGHAEADYSSHGEDVSVIRQRKSLKLHRAQMAAQKKVVLADNFEDQPLLKRLNWLHVPLLVGTPLIALYGLYTTEWQYKTFVWAFVYYLYTGLGITAGYHRLWSHTCYQAHRSVEYLLMLAGTGAVEGSIRWWCRDHRAHHRYVDTPKDPYAVTKGFWYAHIGWMLIKQDKSKIGRCDIRDLDEDPMIRFQHRYYLWLALLMGFIFPSLVAGFGWGDFRGGFYIAGVARLVFVHHSTFCVNSLAHYWGDETYTDNHTAKNSIITALITIGEGYHNFHHEFPSDYRNGVRFYHYDPTKWLIRALSFVGLTYNLKRFPTNEIVKGELQMQQQDLNRRKARVDWGPEVKALPTMTWAEVKQRVKDGADYVVLDGCVLDVADFKLTHPGGEKILGSQLGRDASEAFRGEIYRHSNAAHNLQRTLRVARVSDYVWADAE